MPGDIINIPAIVQNGNHILGAPLYLHVARATAGTDQTPGVAGIAWFNSDDFIIKGAKVSLRFTNSNLLLFADALDTPSLVKLNPNEFEHDPDWDNENAPTAAVRLRRDFITNSVNDARVQASLIKIGADFDLDASGLLVAVYPNEPYVRHSVVRLDANFFTGDPVQIRYPVNNIPSSTNITNGFALVKIDFTTLGINSDGETQVDIGNVGTQLLANANFAKNVQTVVRPAYANTVQAWAQGLLRTDPDDSNFVISNFVEESYGTRTLLGFNKIVIGLDAVDNRSLNADLIQLFGSSSNLPNVPTLLAAKVDTNVFTSGQQVQDQKIAANTTNIGNLQSAVNTLTTGFLGFFTNLNGSPYKQPGDAGYVSNADFLNQQRPVGTSGYDARTHLTLINTSTIWFWTSTTWVDSGLENPEFMNYVELDSTNIKPDGESAGVGSRGYWPNSDHVHPYATRMFLWADGTDADFTAKLININIDQPGANPFVGTFAQTGNIAINIPFVSEAKYIHNYKGQINDVGYAYAWDEEKQMILWEGSTAEMPGTFPEGTIVIVNDDMSIQNGTFVTDTDMNIAIANAIAAIRAGTSNPNTYLLAPTSTGFGWSQFDASNLVRRDLATTKITQAIKPFNANIVNEDFAILKTGAPGSNSGVAGVTAAASMVAMPGGGQNDFVRLGTLSSFYLLESDLSANAKGVTPTQNFLANKMDTLYPVKSTAGATVGSIALSITNLWSSIASTNVNLSSLSDTVSTLATQVTGLPQPVNNNNTYLLRGGNPMTLQLFDTNGLLTGASTFSFANATGGASQNYTFAQIQSAFVEASRVKYSQGASVQNNSAKFVVIMESDFQALQVKDNDTFYFRY